MDARPGSAPRGPDGRRHPAFGWLPGTRLVPQQKNRFPSARRLGEDAGVYCLLLYLPKPRRITAGRLGSRRLAAGWYVYVGSAKRNLAARLRRHLRREKRVHWHIDYLRAVAQVERIWVWAWTAAAECRTNARVQALPGAVVPWIGFGSSDCRCRSHLTAFPWQPGPPSGPPPLTCRGLRTFRTSARPAIDPGLEGTYTSSAPRKGATKERP